MIRKLFKTTTFALLLCALVATSASAVTVKKQQREDLPVGIANSYRGGIGILRLTSPIIMPQTTFSLLGHLRYWQQASFLSEDLNVKNLSSGGSFSVSLNDYFEFFMGAQNSSHLIENEVLDTTSLLQSIGDFQLGFKVAYRFAPIFYGGLSVDGTFRTAQGSLGPEWGATGIGANLLMALDWTALADPTPVRLTLNFGYRRDNSRHLLPDNSLGDPASNYGLGIPWDDDIFAGGLAIEIPQKYLNIFLEYSTEQHIDFNDSNAVVTPTGDTVGRSRKFIENPQRFTPGVRIFPTRAINIDAAVELGSPLFFSNAQYDIYQLGTVEEIMPDWVFHFGLGYTFYPPEPVIPQEGKVVGVIYDRATNEPLRNAIVNFPGSQFTNLLTDRDGQYRSYSFESGPVRIDVARRGYGAASTTVIVKAASEVRQDFYLVKQEEQGKMMAVVVDTSGKPVSTATIQFQEGKIPPLTPDARSGLVESLLPPGVYTIMANAGGYKSKSLRIRIADKKTTKLTITLEPEEQQGTLTGRVENDVGEPLGGIITVKELGQNIASDPQNGQFSSALDVGTYTVRVSVGGYKTQEKTVIIEKDRITAVNFILEAVRQVGKVRGSVVDANTQQGVFGVLTFPNGENGNVATDPESGSFLIELEQGTYQVKVGSSAYQSRIVDVVIEGGETTEITIPLTPYQKVQVTKEKIEIKEKLQFRVGKAIIKIDSYPILDEIASVLKSNPEFNIIVEGHTDSVGSTVANRRLSQRRAEAVREYIISRGIQSSRLEAVGMGEGQPIADNATEEGRALNRRVEFKIVDKEGNSKDTGF